MFSKDYTKKTVIHNRAGVITYPLYNLFARMIPTPSVTLSMFLRSFFFLVSSGGRATWNASASRLYRDLLQSVNRNKFFSSRPSSVFLECILTLQETLSPSCSPEIPEVN